MRSMTQIILTGFCLYWRDRGSIEGGVLVVVANNLSAVIFPNQSIVEMITLKIQSSPSFISCCIYVFPVCPYSYLHDVLKSGQIIVGVFNLPDASWSTLTASSFFMEGLFSLIYSS